MAIALRVASRLLTAIPVLVLAGCGGGGGPQAPANVAPVAAVAATPLYGIAPLVVDLDAGASTDSDGTISAWQWTFGDGNSASGAAVQHTYASAGTYTVTLIVTDDDGATAAASASVTVVANVPPVAAIRADRFEGFAPLVVQFDSTASMDSDGALVARRWDFGNGDSAAIVAPAVLYDVPGQYTAQLTVTDDRGATSVASVAVYVAGPADLFALAGALSVPDSAYADCDTAGGGVPDCNLAIADAQPVAVPAVVGGFAALASDALDHFRVTLAGGETLSLSVADNSAANDLDLALFRAADMTLVAASAQPGVSPETLQVAAAGDYIVRVAAASGASNYVLSFGAGTLSAGGTGDEFVAGEFIAHFTRLRVPWRTEAQREARAAELGLDAVAGDADTPMLLRDRAAAGHLLRGAVAASQPALQRLRRHPDVAWVEANRVRHALATGATDSYYPLQWNLPLAHFPGAWAANPLQGAGTLVAVIDTGIVADHPDLAGRLVSGHDFVSDPDNAADGDGIDADPTDPGGDGLARSTFHGTHIAGIIAANTQFGGGTGNTGIAGAAPATQVMPLRAIGRYGGTTYDIVQAIRYAAGLANASGQLPAQPADVINLSIGSTGYSQAEQEAVNAARAAGVIVVAAGGNSGSEVLVYPAAYAGVVGVGAVTLDRRRASYSTTGAHIDLVAPGGDNTTDLDADGYPDGVLGTLVNDSGGLVVAGYDFYQGTSMAAPHVAAAAALMKAIVPDLTPALFDSLLAAGQLTRDLGAGGRDDQYGMGLLDAEKALVATGAAMVTAPQAVASPTRLGFGASTTQALVVVDNGGGGALQVSGVVTDQSWLTVGAQAVDGDGLGSYRVDVLRTGLAGGMHEGTVTFSTSAGSLAVPVSLLVDAAIPAAAAGTLYVIAWDPVAQVTVAGSPGLVAGATGFDLGPVLAGTYQVYAGTDNDNDGLICDPGEACGAWQTLSHPERFAHVRDRTDLSFVVGYGAMLGTLSHGGSLAGPVVGAASVADGMPAGGLPRHP